MAQSSTVPEVSFRSSRNTVRFSNVFLSTQMYSLAFSPYAGGPIIMDHENTVKAYSASPSMLGRGHSLMEPQGPVWVRQVAREAHPLLKNFAVCACLRFSSSTSRWRYRWDLLDNQFVEKNETRRHCGMYFIHSQSFETSILTLLPEKAVYGIQNLSNGL